MDEEIEVCFCKNACKGNKSMTVNQARKNKFTCDACMKCPLCQTILKIKKNQG